MDRGLHFLPKTVSSALGACRNYYRAISYIYSVPLIGIAGHPYISVYPKRLIGNLLDNVSGRNVDLDTLSLVRTSDRNADKLMSVTSLAYSGLRWLLPLPVASGPIQDLVGSFYG